jgi:hypothetical protein
MYLHKGIYKKGYMEWDLDRTIWRFSQHHKNGIEIFGINLPNFCQHFQQFIDDGTLIPISIQSPMPHTSRLSYDSIIPP